MELFVSLQKLCEPKAQCGWLPGDFPPQVWYTGIKNIVQGITEVLGVQDIISFKASLILIFFRNYSFLQLI